MFHEFHDDKRENGKILDFVVDMWSTPTCQSSEISELLEDGLRELVCEVDIPDTVPVSWRGLQKSHMGHERHSKLAIVLFFVLFFFFGPGFFRNTHTVICHCLYMFKLSPFVLKA